MIDLHPTTQIYDSSKIQEFMECERRYFFRYILGWTPDVPNNHLVFGSAWHKAMEQILLTGYSNDSIRMAINAFNEEYRRELGPETDELFAPKDPRIIPQALVEYCENYRNDSFDVFHTEVAGKVSVDERRDIHFKLDAILKGERGYFALEHKTGSVLSSAWVNQWSLRFQVWTYSHAIYCLYPTEEVDGVIINGTIFNKGGRKFQRVPIRKSKDMMQAGMWNAQYFLDMIEWNMEELSRCNESDPVLMAFPMRTTSCCTWKTCQYHNLCLSWANPLQHCSEPPIGYRVEWWNPMDREETAKTSMSIASDGTVSVRHSENSEPNKEEGGVLDVFGYQGGIGEASDYVSGEFDI